MKETTKKIVAACLPLIGLAIWVPQFLKKDGERDAQAQASTQASADALQENAWFDEPMVDVGDSEPGVDVLELGARGTLERVDRLQQILSGAELFRVPDNGRQARIVEALELAVRNVARVSETQLVSATDTEGLFADVAAHQGESVLAASLEQRFEAWAASRTVGGILADPEGARCLLGGRVFSTGDCAGYLQESDLPLIISTIEADAVVVSHGDLRTRIALRADQQ